MPATRRLAATTLVAVLLILAAPATAHLTAVDAPPENPAREHLVHRQWDVDAAFDRWEATWPDFVERFTIGTTTGGHDMLGVRVTDLNVTGNASGLSTGEKLRVYLDGGHHGNEYMGTELIMYWLEDVLTRAADGDADALGLLATHDVYAVPIVNVEGNLADTRKNVNQVDLNRNYPFEWGGEGSSDNPASFAYRGPEPLSEAETRANAAFAESLDPDLWVTMHTGIAELYWPWGYTHDAPPDDAMFTSMEASFEAATNGRVDAMQAAELYVASGATDDYGYGALGTPTFTYEVHEDQFVPAYGEPVPEVIADQLAGLDWLIRETQFMGAWVTPTVDGDDLVLENVGRGVARNVTVSVDDIARTVAEIPAGDTVTLPLDEAQGAVTVTYPALTINSTRERTHHLDPVDAHAADEGVTTVPPPGAAWALAVLGLAGILSRVRARS